MELTKFELKNISSLKIKKFRDQTNSFVVEGIKMNKELLNSNMFIEKMVISGSFANDPKIKSLMQLASKSKIPVFVVKDKEFYKLSSLVTSQGILSVVRQVNNTRNKNNSYIILDDIKDPGNMGSIIRSADWFGINDVIVSENSVDVYNPKVIQASMGSIFRVNTVIDANLEELLSELKIENYQIIGTSLDGKDSLPENLNKKFAILIGNESNGININLNKYLTCAYKIPGSGNVESLNASVATGIVLFQIFNNKK